MRCCAGCVAFLAVVLFGAGVAGEVRVLRGVSGVRVRFGLRLSVFNGLSGGCPVCCPCGVPGAELTRSRRNEPEALKYMPPSWANCIPFLSWENRRVDHGSVTHSRITIFRVHSGSKGI